MNPITADDGLGLWKDPEFRISDRWYPSFTDALMNARGEITWDLSSVLSMISFHHTCGESTLVQEIRKDPWLSVIEGNSIHLLPVPGHGYHFEDSSRIAGNLFGLLVEEMITACKGFQKGYLLLSGGLDSRIVACALYQGMQKGMISTDFTALTWGLPDSRDVRISELIAGKLGFKWINIDLSPAILLRNIDLAAWDLGCMTNAYHLHGLSWFLDNGSKDAIVIGGSYGDGIGRAEYSGRHVLELDLMNPVNRFNLIRNEYLPVLKKQLVIPLQTLRNRYAWKHKHEICEAERQSQYMRNLIAHSMSLINQNGLLYQAFTSPPVYSYMWTIHPSLRNDNIYKKILSDFGHGISELPWARTNRALSGHTRKIDPSLRPGFHRYREWISKILFTELYASLDFQLFEEIRIIDPLQVRKLATIVKEPSDEFHAYNLFLWLVGLSRFNLKLKENGIRINIPEIVPDFKPTSKANRRPVFSVLNTMNKQDLFPMLKKIFKKLRKKVLLWYFFIRHLPEQNG